MCLIMKGGIRFQDYQDSLGSAGFGSRRILLWQSCHLQQDSKSVKGAYRPGPMFRFSSHKLRKNVKPSPEQKPKHKTKHDSPRYHPTHKHFDDL